ncbi:MAG: hypothetical protein K8R54_04315 [Bacteroidales bacterium]|nr:hypothetical protein [Bacteroidales bacterium]
MIKKKSPSKTKTYINARKEFLDWVYSNSTIKSDYSRWYAGMTNKTNIRKTDHNSKMPNGTPFWKKINCKSRKIAESLETSLHKLGFLNTDKKGGIDDNSTYVYIFKQYPTIFDSIR